MCNDNVWRTWDGYMARIVGWVAVCETTRKKAAGSDVSQDNKSSGMDRPAPNKPCLPHNQVSVEDAPFSEPYHQAADFGQRVQGRKCAGHQPQDVEEVGDVAEVSMRDRGVCRFRRLSTNLMCQAYSTSIPLKINR